MSDFFPHKRVFITGGSSGIGLATAQLLASRGCRLVLMARNPDGLAQARDQIQQQAKTAIQPVQTVPLDVADPEAVTKKIDQAVTDFGPPDILINSAGIATADYFENISYEQFDALLKINLYGTRNTISAVLPHMKKNQGGHIVNLASAAGLVGMFGYSLYSASKYALVGFSECLRSEFKPHHIGVTVVCPPEVKTPFIREEARTLPPESRAVKALAGLLPPEAVARNIVRAIERQQFMVVPGWRARWLCLCHRLSNGRLIRRPSDWIVRRAAARKNS